MRNVSTCASIFLNFYMIRRRLHQHCCQFVGEKKSVLNQVQMGSALVSCWRRKDVCSEPTSLNDLPDEILLKILSYFGPEDLCFVIAKVCEKWNILAKDKTLWKTLSYSCDHYSDISRIAEVRCTALLGFSTN
jgi:hypothetical protein